MLAETCSRKYVQSTSNILRIVCAFVGKHKRFEYLKTYLISNINVLVCPAANIYFSLSAELTVFLFIFNLSFSPTCSLKSSPLYLSLLDLLAFICHFYKLTACKLPYNWYTLALTDSKFHPLPKFPANVRFYESKCLPKTETFFSIHGGSLFQSVLQCKL
jgi:hypothetical protein